MTQRVVNYTYGTGNPVLPDGSIDVRDGIDNLQSMDVFMNAPEDTYNQRDGEVVRTVAGMNNEFDSMISEMNSEFDGQILNMGFTRVGTFASGATLTNPRQTLLWDIADGGDGQEYGWSGTFPKIVPASSTPASTGGISVGAWISRFDPELRIQVREALRRSYAEAGYNLVDGSFEAGGTLVNANDVLLHEASGKAFTGPAGTVAPGTDPTSGGFVERSGNLLRDNSSITFATVSDIISASSYLRAGDTVAALDYATDHNSGTLFFKVVPSGTGVHDGGQYIDIPSSSLQLKQNLEYPYNAKAWGASSVSSPSANDIAFLALMTFAAANRTNNRYRTEINLGGDSYNISAPVVVRSSGVKFTNGVINQTVNTKDAMQSDGSTGTIYYLELNNVELNIKGAPLPNQFSGSNFRHVTGTLGWFKWTGLSSIMAQGQHGFANGFGSDSGTNKGGPIWMLELNRLWFNAGWSSSLFIPSNGGSFSLVDFDGGSTTYKISNVHTTNIQSGSPAYRLGNGIDHAILENVTADSCTKFGEFKVKSLLLRNCGMEEIKPPTDATAKAQFYGASEHNLILVGQQQSLSIDGFTTAFGAELQATPHPQTNHIATDSVSSHISGVVGGTVSTGRVLRISGGYCVAERISVPNALSDKVINGGRVNYKNRQRFVSTSSKNNTFDLFDVDPSGPRAYLITLTYAFSNNSSINTFICHTSGTSGGLKGNAVLLLGAIDFSGATLTVSGGKVTATVPNNTFVDWTAVDLTSL